MDPKSDTAADGGTQEDTWPWDRALGNPNLWLLLPPALLSHRSRLSKGPQQFHRLHPGSGTGIAPRLISSGIPTGMCSPALPREAAPPGQTSPSSITAFFLPCSSFIKFFPYHGL